MQKLICICSCIQQIWTHTHGQSHALQMYLKVCTHWPRQRHDSNSAEKCAHCCLQKQHTQTQHNTQKRRVCSTRFSNWTHTCAQIQIQIHSYRYCCRYRYSGSVAIWCSRAFNRCVVTSTRPARNHFKLIINGASSAGIKLVEQIHEYPFACYLFSTLSFSASLSLFLSLCLCLFVCIAWNVVETDFLRVFFSIYRLGARLARVCVLMCVCV